jgi:hypothetical protein
MAGHPPGQPLRVAQALERSEGFVGLMRRLEQAQRCYAAIGPLLPAELCRAVRPGPLTDESWSLLADSAAAAAKLRQLLPLLQCELASSGLLEVPMRVKVARRR